MLLLRVIFAVLSVVAIPSFAGPCDGSLNEQAGGQAPSDLDSKFKNLAQQWQTGWTDRGFMGLQDGVPALNAESYMYAMKNGMMWWNLRIYFAKDLEDAKAHDAQVSDSLLKGVYVLGVEESAVEFASDEDANQPRRKVKGETMRQVLEKANGFVEFHPATGEVRHTPMSEIAKRLDFVPLTKIAPDKAAMGRHFFAHEGWAATKKRGILYYSEWEKSDAIQRSRKLARQLTRLGYQIKYNGDYKKALEMARDQKRVIIENNVKRHEQNSRYHSKSLFEAAMQMYEKGMAFSVELYRPDGKMIAGSINFRNGNLIMGDTIFYDIDETVYTDEQGKDREVDAIEYAKLVDVLTMDYMAAAGVKILDVGMVSPYSASIRANYFPRETYLQEIENLPKQPIELPSVLDAFQYPDLNFAELAKGIQVKGIGKAFFVGGYPLATSHSVAKAAEHRLMPGELAIVVVRDSNEAVAHARKLKEQGRALNVIYSVGPESDVVAFVMKNGAYSVDAETGKVKPIQAQRFKNILNPSLSSQYVSWQRDEVVGSYVAVKGWQLAP